MYLVLFVVYLLNTKLFAIIIFIFNLFGAVQILKIYYLKFIQRFQTKFYA